MILFLFCLPEGKKHQVVGAVSLEINAKEGKDAIREAGVFTENFIPLGDVL